MFENYLNIEEKKVMLKVLAFLSNVDGTKQEEEINFINYVAQGLNLDSSDIFEQIKGLNLKEVLAEITNEKSKNIFILIILNYFFILYKEKMNIIILF